VAAGAGAEAAGVVAEGVVAEGAFVAGAAAGPHAASRPMATIATAAINRLTFLATELIFIPYTFLTRYLCFAVLFTNMQQIVFNLPSSLK
jgi:uncharacterized RDD family membrane protein YckC